MSPISLQPKRIATTALDDAVAGDLIGSHDQDRLRIAGRLLLRRPHGEGKAVAGNVRGQVGQGCGGRIVPAGVAGIGC